MLKNVIIATLFFILASPARADEGMWLPMLIKRLNQADMEKYGLQLTAEEIYSVNQSSLKDAIVSFGGFCSGEIISDQGLLLTNLHCAANSVPPGSSANKNDRNEGFWAMSRKEELPVHNLYARFLIRMEDVTERISAALDNGMSEEERALAISRISKLIVQEEKRFSHYDVVVKEFFAGNEFYLFVYETFTDLRLVGAPPESIGKFGSETDNWMWPRHTGDFALFRVYSGPDGKPAPYSPNNVPLVPKHHLPISLIGVQEGDFTMVMGYPGSTDRYLTSFGVKQTLDHDNPLRIKIRDRQLDIVKEEMETHEDTDEKYASKNQALKNYIKFFSGQSRGLLRMDILAEKESLENEFILWDSTRKRNNKEYREALKLVKESYEEGNDENLSYMYMAEAVLAIEILKFANSFRGLESALALKEHNPTRIKGLTESLKEYTENHFNTYSPSVDQKVMAELLSMYYNEVPSKDHPEVMEFVKKNFGGDFGSWASFVFKQSIFADREKTEYFLQNPDREILRQDPAYIAITSFMDNYNKVIFPRIKDLHLKRDRGNRLFLKGLREMKPGKKYYPDANGTMRLSFGKVLGYRARDAVEFKPYTTLAGVMEKMDSSRQEFRVPEKLIKLYHEKDFGPYVNQKGELVTAFITNNDITRGSSGSPVLDSKGRLLGTVFDGNTEAMSGDIAFDPELQRCVNIDIRYCLFIIDKFAGAGYLVQEMTLIKDEADKGRNKEARQRK